MGKFPNGKVGSFSTRERERERERDDRWSSCGTFSCPSAYGRPEFWVNGWFSREEGCRTDMVLVESSHVPLARAHHHRRQHRKSWCCRVVVLYSKRGETCSYCVLIAVLVLYYLWHIMVHAAVFFACGGRNENGHQARPYSTPSTKINRLTN
jgi:hypothetical protein